MVTPKRKVLHVAGFLFLVFGFLGFWSWSWAFFLLIPVAGIIVYGLGGNRRSS